MVGEKLYLWQSRVGQLGWATFEDTTYSSIQGALEALATIAGEQGITVFGLTIGPEGTPWSDYICAHGMTNSMVREKFSTELNTQPEPEGTFNSGSANGGDLDAGPKKDAPQQESSNSQLSSS